MTYIVLVQPKFHIHGICARTRQMEHRYIHDLDELFQLRPIHQLWLVPRTTPVHLVVSHRRLHFREYARCCLKPIQNHVQLKATHFQNN